MAESILFITGVSGFVGFRILVDALRAGHKVRASVRNADKEKYVRSNTYLQEVLASKGADKLEFVHIPDVLSPTAYDRTLSDGKISHIIHCATPLPHATNNIRRDLIDPSRQGTLNLVEAASRVKSVRRIVLTASVASNISFPPSSGVITTAATRIADPTDAEIDGLGDDIRTGYFYSKIVALNATDRYIASNPNLGFDIVNVLPGFVTGPDLRALKADDLNSGSNSITLNGALGHQGPARLAATVHIDDVSAIHLAALEESVVQFKSRVDLLATVDMELGDLWETIQQRFPEAIKDGTFKQGSNEGIYHFGWDASDTEKRVGLKLKPYEEQIVDLLTQYLSLLKA